MKRKLLITLGCSFTEGVGCYDFSFNPEKKLYSELSPELCDLQRNIFHREGWPNRVGKKLGYDKVINLGMGGSSNCAHLKLFTDKVLPLIDDLKKNYDILVIWMMTANARFSFYSDYNLQSFSPGRNILDPPSVRPLEKAYLEDMPEVRIGPAREQIFLIKISSYLFQNLGIKFLYSSWADELYLPFKYVDRRYWLIPAPKAIDLYRNSNDTCELCGHPNENGYEYISDNIVKAIKKYHPSLYSGPPVDEIEWEYLGDVTYGLPKYNNLL